MKRLCFPHCCTVLVGGASAALRIDPNTRVTSPTATWVTRTERPLEPCQRDLYFDPPTAASASRSDPAVEPEHGSCQLDEHMATADFFDVGKFPTATFKSSKVEVVSKDKLRVSGEITILGSPVPWHST